MAQIRLSALLLLAAGVAVAAAAEGEGAPAKKENPMNEVFAWKQVDFAWPDEAAAAKAREMGDFLPENNIPLGLDVAGHRLFVTVPRWRKGVAATLNVIEINNETMAAKSPKLTPYPSWEANKVPAEGEPTEGKVVSVFRVRADQCRRLWVLDTGLDDLLGETRRVAPARLLVYDLNTDLLVREYALKDTDVKPDSFWAHIAVDTSKDRCDKAWAYLSDVGAQALTVYSWEDNDSWRVEHHFFHFDPIKGALRVGGVDFQWSDGVFGVALSPADADGARTVYFHPLASDNEFSVPSDVLRNKSAAGEYFAYKLLGSRGSNAQSTASFLHEKTGVLFYTLINRDSIGCWNTNKAFSEAAQGVVARDSEGLVFPNDLKVCGNDNLWVLSNRLSTFLYGKLNPEDVNFRVYYLPVAEAVRGTPCE